MKESNKDRWAEWLLERRFRGVELERKKAFLEYLIPVRDRVLNNAALSGGMTLLDVGAGDGLIAFGALDRLGEDGSVIFADISKDLLDHSGKLADEAGVTERCSFLQAPADDLSALGDESVSAVTTRSVLIYVEDKKRSFAEFYRVLKPGGRLSIFEPINRFRCLEPPGSYLGYDVTPVQGLARKVRAVYERIQPLDSDPMLDFDERDPFDFTENAGFEKIHLDYEAEVSFSEPQSHGVSSWENFLKVTGNPRIPTIGEAMDESLTPEEKERFTAHLKPLVEGSRRKKHEAVAYLRAVKGGS